MTIQVYVDKDHYAMTDLVGIGTDLYDDNSAAELRLYRNNGELAVKIGATPKELRRLLRNGLEGLKRLKR